MSSSSRGIGLTVFVATMLACVLVAGSLIIGRATAVPTPLPNSISAEAGFARDMQVHHDQAVEMSMMVRDRTDDPDIRLLAYDIATSQSQQSGQMYGWLATWGVPQASPEPAMTWMHRAVPGDGTHTEHETSETPADVPATMPGMASREDLEHLRALSGKAAERQFLELMIAHHKGGLEMADAVLARTSQPVVTDLASSIVRAQTSEIGLMQDLLAERTTDAA